MYKVLFLLAVLSGSNATYFFQNVGTLDTSNVLWIVINGLVAVVSGLTYWNIVYQIRNPESRTKVFIEFWQETSWGDR